MVKAVFLRMDVFLFFVDDFFYTGQPIEVKLKIYHYFNKKKKKNEMKNEALISFFNKTCSVMRFS